MRIRISLKSLCLALVVLAVLFSVIGMAWRRSVRYRAGNFASLHTAKLSADICGDYVMRYHPSGDWNSNLRLNADGTFAASQGNGPRGLTFADGTYSVSGRILKLRYRKYPNDWNPYQDFKWAVILEIDGAVVLVPDQHCEKDIVGEDANSYVPKKHYFAREEHIDTVQEPLGKKVADFVEANYSD